MKRWSVLAVLVLGALAVAGTRPTGWSEGIPAVGAKRVLTGPDVELPALQLPKEVAKQVQGKTLLFYFSPTCPHCRNVAHEVQALHARLEARDAKVVGIASSRATAGQLDEFNKTYGIRFPIITDSDSSIISQLGIRSTPSAVLLEPTKDGKQQVVDAWYPYQPGFDFFVEARVVDDAWSLFEEDKYMGTARCGGCHLDEYESWALTHHSVAWNTLNRIKKTEDSECTSCHVTGAGQPTGWTPGDEHSMLTDVGCESCHGPAGPHDGKPSVATDSCVQCHDEKHSISFSVNKGLPLIDHYASVKMGDKDFTEKRKALVGGTADRPLLAFDDGEYVGNQACATCHADATAHWKQSPHGKAMATLQAQKKDTNVQCVSCHATPKTVGSRPTKVSGYRVEDAVGCESCHGPGKAHVDAGGTKDTIERLGDDCPVCVIEAVCTSCHTQDQDPEWNLEADLPKVFHKALP